MEQEVIIKNREALSISGVEHIYFFNDKKVEIRTCFGDMLIEGENLDLNKLNLDENVINIQGTINTVVYSKDKKNKESFIKRIFK